MCEMTCAIAVIDARLASLALGVFALNLAIRKSSMLRAHTVSSAADMHFEPRS